MDWNELFYRKKDIDEMRTRLAELRFRATSISRKADGMPHGTGTGRGLEDKAIAIADLQEVYECSLIEYYRCQKLFEMEITKISDPGVRLIGILRFIQMQTWGQIARYLQEDEDAVKKQWYRSQRKKAQ